MFLISRSRQAMKITFMYVVIVLLMPFSCFAGTIVRVSTSIGDFSVELFDDSAPTLNSHVGILARHELPARAGA